MTEDYVIHPRYAALATVKASTFGAPWFDAVGRRRIRAMSDEDFKAFLMTGRDPNPKEEKTMSTETAKKEMPKYKCHKVVHALKIKEICRDPGGRPGGRIIPVNLGFQGISVSEEYLNKHHPKPGGYYVVYEGGYESFSPADAFEGGYTEDEGPQPGECTTVKYEVVQDDGKGLVEHIRKADGEIAKLHIHSDEMDDLQAWIHKLLTSGESATTKRVPETGMTFGDAIEAARHGLKIARKIWNCSGAFLYIVDGSNVPKENLRGRCAEAVSPSVLDGASVDIFPHIDMKTSGGSIVIGWSASQSDMLADDWCVVR